MIVYKLTSDKDTTKNNTRWGPGVTHTVSGKGPLCSNGWLHFTYSPELAALLDIIQGDYIRTYSGNAHLWKAGAAEPILDDYGRKGGTAQLTTLEQIPLQEATPVQSIRFGILCVQQVYPGSAWKEWASRWLSGEDRSTSPALKAQASMYSNDAIPFNVAVDAVFAAEHSSPRIAVYAASAAAAYAVGTLKKPIDLLSLARQAFAPDGTVQ